jgi:restriction system protein
LRAVRIDGRVVMTEVVKRLFRQAGSSKSEVANIAAHGLRRGFVTSADVAGATTAQIMDATGHRDPKSLRRYTRRELLHDSVLPKISACDSKTIDVSIPSEFSANERTNQHMSLLLLFNPSQSPVSIVLQTVVLAGEKTSAGQLIEAVAIPWFDLIRLIQENPATAFEISPRKWEEIVAGAYKKAGFDEVTLTPSSGDLGRDVIAVKRGIGIVRVIDQVKAYKPGVLVTANDVRALMGVLHGDGASKGFVTTTSDFAPRLRTDPLLMPFMPSRLELINGSQLFARLSELAGDVSLGR